MKHMIYESEDDDSDGFVFECEMDNLNVKRSGVMVITSGKNHATTILKNKIRLLLTGD